MSLGRGKMLQSVKQKVENDLEGRVWQYHMADYTNESIEKFCRELTNKEYLKDAGNQSFGNNRDLSEVKSDISQFDDADAVRHDVSSVTDSTNSDAEGSGISSCSLQSRVNDEETSSMLYFSHSSDNSSGSPTSYKNFQSKERFSRQRVNEEETSPLRSSSHCSGISNRSPAKSQKNFQNEPFHRQRVNEQETTPDRSSYHSSGISNRSPGNSQKNFESKEPLPRLAARWPERLTTSKHLATAFPAAAMGRGRSLQMVSAKCASATKSDPQREIMLACDPSYTNDRIEDYLNKMIFKNETRKEF